MWLNLLQLCSTCNYNSNKICINVIGTKSQAVCKHQQEIYLFTINIASISKYLTEWWENYWLISCKDMEEISYVIIWGTPLAFVRRDCEKLCQPQVTKFHNQLEWDTTHLQVRADTAWTNMNDITKYILWFIVEHSSRTVSGTEYRRL